LLLLRLLAYTFGWELVFVFLPFADFSVHGYEMKVFLCGGGGRGRVGGDGMKIGV
jgi:hypothetical protein